MVLLHDPIVPNGLDRIDHPFGGGRGGEADVEQAGTSIYQLYLLTFYQLYLLTFSFHVVPPPPHGLVKQRRASRNF